MTVNGSNLSMTRGDSESITVSIENYQFESGDVVEFSVRKKANAWPIVLHKKITEFDEDGKATIYIDPKDTSNIAFGDYIYDIQWTTAGGSVSTIIKPSRFVISEEVTYGIS